MKIVHPAALTPCLVAAFTKHDIRWAFVDRWQQLETEPALAELISHYFTDPGIYGLSIEQLIELVAPEFSSGSPTWHPLVWPPHQA